MYRDSRDQLFTLMARINQRARELFQHAAGPVAPSSLPPDVQAEARSLEAGVELRLPRLVERFRLSPMGVQALTCLLATEYDPFLRLLLRAVQRETGRPWLEVGTIAELLDLPPRAMPDLARLFDRQGELVRRALVLVDDAGGETPAVSLRVKVSGRVARHLAEIDELPDHMELVTPRVRAPRSLVPEAIQRGTEGRLRQALVVGEPLVLAVSGPARVGKRCFAEELASRLERNLLVVDLARLDRPRLDLALAEAQRDACLWDAVLCLVHLDALFPNAPMPDEHGVPWPRPRRCPEP
jgi:hypothetical protein